MKTKTTRFIAIACTTVLAACSTVSVTTDYDRSAPFKQYKTYALAPPARGETLSPSSEAALRDTLRVEMAKKGIVEKTSGKPDIAVARHVFLQDKVSVQQYTDWGYDRPGYMPYRYGYYGTWAGAPQTYVDVTEYTQGTLILDFVDAQTHKLVFRGKGSAVVAGPDANAGKIREAVTRIVADFPSP
jgi:hypothetical protein